MTFGAINAIGALNRVDATANATNQAGDHNTFQAKIDALIAAGVSLEDIVTAANNAQATENASLQTQITALVNNVTLATLAEPFAGIQVPAGSLEHFWGGTGAPRRLVTIGDSTEQQTTGSCSLGQGGKGTCSELLAMWLDGTYGTLVSPGLRPIWYSGSTFGFASGYSEYTFASANPGPWAAFGRTTAGDVAPFGRAIVGTGSGNIATWTKPTAWNNLTRGPWANTFTGVEVLYIDVPGSGGASVRADGVGNWVNVGNETLGDNKLKSAYFTFATSATTTIEVRCGNQIGNGGKFCFVGFRPYWVPPVGTPAGSGIASRFYVDNLGHDSNFLSSFVNSASTGDPLAILNNVGGGYTPPPAHVSVCFTNDQSFAYSSAWTNNLSAILSRVQAGGGDMLHISRYEQASRAAGDVLTNYGGPVPEYSYQHAYRAGSKAWAALNNVAYYDEYAHFGARGYWGQAQANPYLNNSLHPTQEGIYDEFQLRKRILNVFA